MNTAISNKVNQKNYFSHYNNKYHRLKYTKKQIVNSAIDLKEKLKALNPDKRTDILNILDKLALKIQHKINQGTLSRDDITPYRKQFNELINNNSYNQDFEDYVKCCMLSSKHATESETKWNFFGTTNKTSSIQQLLKNTKYEDITSDLELLTRLFNDNISQIHFTITNDWRKVKFGKLNLSKEDLKNIDFRYTNLENIDFICDSLEKIDFTGAILKNVDFKVALLKNIQFKGAKLSNVQFKGSQLNATNLKEANFESANLNNVHFKYTNLEKANFESANLQNIKFTESDLKEANFQKATFWWTTFDIVNLQKAIFTSANLHNIKFTESDLKEANFQKATFWWTTFDIVNLQKAIFTSANLHNIKFTESDLKEANFQKATFWHTEFNIVELQNAIFEKAVFQVIQFKNVNCENTNFNQAIFTNINCNNVNFKNAKLTNVKINDKLYSTCFKDADKPNKSKFMIFLFENIALFPIDNIESSKLPNTNSKNTLLFEENPSIRVKDLDISNILDVLNIIDAISDKNNDKNTFIKNTLMQQVFKYLSCRDITNFIKSFREILFNGSYDYTKTLKAQPTFNKKLFDEILKLNTQPLSKSEAKWFIDNIYQAENYNETLKKIPMNNNQFLIELKEFVMKNFDFEDIMYKTALTIDEDLKKLKIKIDK